MSNQGETNKDMQQHAQLVTNFSLIERTPFNS